MATIVSSALFAACTPSTPPAATPTPPPSATSVTPTETEFQRQERVAYEAAYRGFRDEYSTVITHSFSPRVTKAMRATAGGPYLRTYQAFLKQRRQRALRSTAGIDVKSIKRLTYRTDSVLLRACEDGTAGRLVNKKGKVVENGTAFRIRVEVRLVAGQWKVWVGDQQKDVTSCRN